LLYQWLTLENKGEGEFVAQVRTDEESAWYAGHFVNDPILPGVAQLHMVSELLQQVMVNNCFPSAFKRVKFRKIVRPGELLDIHVTPGNKDNHFVFSITANRADVCSGTVIMQS